MTERLAGRTAGGPTWPSFLFKGPARTSRPTWCCKGVVAHDVTAPGQLRGNSDHANPVRSEHVVIFFDVKRSGEATHKPHLRIFPLQRGEASFKPLFEAARARFTPQLPPGGRRHPMGWRRRLPARWGDGPHVPAQSVSKQGQGFQVAHCAERCEQRGLQARARAHIRQTETLLIVSQNQITVPPIKRQTYPGGK